MFKSGVAILRTLFLSLLMLCPMTFVERTAQADEGFRVATVDINKVLNESEKAQKRRKELDQESMKAKKKVEEKRAQLQKEEKRLKEKKAQEGSEEVEDFRAEAKELARFVKDTEEELRRKFMVSNGELTEEVLKVVQSYAKKNDLDLVLNKSESGRGPVLFGNATVDITDDIISEVNG